MKTKKCNKYFIGEIKAKSITYINRIEIQKLVDDLIERFFSKKEDGEFDKFIGDIYEDDDKQKNK